MPVIPLYRKIYKMQTVFARRQCLRAKIFLARIHLPVLRLPEGRPVRLRSVQRIRCQDIAVLASLLTEQLIFHARRDGICLVPVVKHVGIMLSGRGVGKRHARRRTAPKCGRRILRSIKSVLIIQYDLLIPRDIERLRQRSAAGIVRAPAPRGDARKSVCPDWENSITAPRRGNTRPCPAENKTSCAPGSAAGTRFSPAEPLFLCGGRVFRLNFT